MSILSKGVIWNFSRTIVERGILFLQQILLAKFLVPEIFGTYASISSILALTSIITLFGYSEVLGYRYKAIGFWSPHYNLGAIILSLISYLLYFLFSIYLNSFAKEELIFVLIYGLIIPLNSFKTLDLIKLQVEGEYGFIAKVKVTQTLILFSFSIYLAYIGYKLEAIIISTIISAIFEFSSYKFKTRLELKFSNNYKKAFLLFFKSSRMIGFNFSWRLINFIDFILIVHLIGNDKGGLYFMAFGISVQTLNLFISYLPSLFFTSNIRDNLTPQQVEIRIQKLILFLILFTAPLLIGLSIYSREIVFLFLNDSWKGTTILIKVLSIAMIFRVISSPWHLVFLSKKKYLLLSKISLFYAFLFFILFYAGTFYFGLLGSSYSILIFYIITLLLVFKIFFLNNKYLKASLQILILSFFSVVLPRIIINFNNELTNLLIGVLSSILLYVFLVYRLNKPTYNLVRFHLNK